MKTASTEREAIVAYLRAEAADARRIAGILQDAEQFDEERDQWDKAYKWEEAADAIERGDHLKDKDHGRA